MGMAGRGMMLHSGGPNSVWHCGGRGVGTAQEKADTAGRDRPSSGCNPLRCCCGGGLASDGVLVPGTRTGGNCVRGQAEVGPSSMDVGLAGAQATVLGPEAHFDRFCHACLVLSQLALRMQFGIYIQRHPPR